MDRKVVKDNKTRKKETNNPVILSEQDDNIAM